VEAAPEDEHNDGHDDNGQTETVQDASHAPGPGVQRRSSILTRNARAPPLVSVVFIWKPTPLTDGSVWRNCSTKCFSSENSVVSVCPGLAPHG
jgi:hypothetical protein